MQCLSHASASFSTSETVTSSSAKGKQIPTRYMQRAHLRGAFCVLSHQSSALLSLVPLTAFYEFAVNSLLRTCKIPSELVSSKRRGNSSPLLLLFLQTSLTTGEKSWWQIQKLYVSLPVLFLSSNYCKCSWSPIPSSETEPCHWLMIVESLVLVGLHSQSAKT